MFKIVKDDWNDVSTKIVLQDAIGMITIYNDTPYIIRVVCEEKCINFEIAPYKNTMLNRHLFYLNDELCFYYDNKNIGNVVLTNFFERTIRIKI